MLKLFDAAKEIIETVGAWTMFFFGIKFVYSRVQALCHHVDQI